MGQTDTITIGNGLLEAHVSPRGAELLRLVHRTWGDLLWTPDPRYWSATSPILFPVIGRSPGGTVRVDGVDHPMPPHGFAAASPFVVAAHERDACALVLNDDGQTRAAYPFPFRLQIDYRLEAGAIVCSATVTNPGDAPLPASFGYHPGFRWPLPGVTGKHGHELIFPDDDHLDCRVLIDGVLAPDVERLALVDHRLALSEDLFATSAQIVLNYRSRTIRYGHRAGPEITVTRENLPQLGLWMRPGGSYVCIEPWHGHTAPAGFSGELRDRPGGFVLAPGEARSFTMTISAHDAASSA